jgi:hypothetical protein
MAKPEMPPEMAKAADLVGGPERLAAMIDQMARALSFLDHHDWVRFGFVMQKGECRVVLTFDGAIMVHGNAPDSEIPAEIHEIARKGGQFDA